MRSRAFGVVAAVGLAALVSACVNHYQRNYQPATIDYGQLAPFTGEPQVASGSKDAEADIARMYADGYALIGHAKFSAPQTSQSLAAQQAKAVGASHVLLVTEYERTVSSMMPMTTPTTQTTYTGGTANAYGLGGGSAWGNYSGTTTTYGTQTTYVPLNVDRYAHGALFFAPLTRTGLGIFRREGNDQEKQRAGTNKIATVLAVRRGSPAYAADLLPGDLLVSIDGLDFGDYAAISKYLGTYPGREMALVLVRGTHRVEKKIVNPVGSW